MALCNLGGHKQWSSLAQSELGLTRRGASRDFVTHISWLVDPNSTRNGKNVDGHTNSIFVFPKSKNMMKFIRFLSLLATAAVYLVGAEDEGYGVDCSFPIHSLDFKCGDLLGDRKAVYEEYMQGCREKWGEKGARRCDQNEADRIEMSLRQPQSMVVSP